MFPKFTLTQSDRMFRSQKHLREKTKRRFKADLQRVVKPDIQKRVDALLGADPGPVKRPFVFSDDPEQNARIRAAYFATNGFGKGIPYRRTDNLRTSWRVDMKTQLSREFVVVTNPKSYAEYVYGSAKQRQVPGHKATGWGKDFDAKIALINDRAVILIKQTWQNAVRASMRSAA